MKRQEDSKTSFESEEKVETLPKNLILEQLDSLVELQREKMRAMALAILPHLTDDDLLQPNDFPELEHHPYFRHEEGVLEGIMSARALVRAHNPGL